MYVRCLYLCVDPSQAGQRYDTDAGSYMRENEALAIANSHIKTVLLYGMVRALMLHPIALDYSCSGTAHGRLHVYVITVISYKPQLYYYQDEHSNTLSDSRIAHCFGPIILKPDFMPEGQLPLLQVFDGGGRG